MLKYLWLPQDLLALPEADRLHLGEMKSLVSWEDAVIQARARFHRPRLIVTIYRVSGKTSTVTVTSDGASSDITFDPGDSCYPISTDEWDIFLAQEAEYCRLPMQVYAVDATRYTAPI